MVAISTKEPASGEWQIDGSDLLSSVINLDYAADLTEFIQDWALRPISRPKRGFSSYRVSGPFLECPAQGLALQAVWGSREGDGR